VTRCCKSGSANDDAPTRATLQDAAGRHRVAPSPPYFLRDVAAGRPEDVSAARASSVLYGLLVDVGGVGAISFQQRHAGTSTQFVVSSGELDEHVKRRVTDGAMATPCYSPVTLPFLFVRRKWTKPAGPRPDGVAGSRNGQLAESRRQPKPAFALCAFVGCSLRPG